MFLLLVLVKIQNQNNSGRTGTLKVAIYATNYPYSGGYLNGYLLFEYHVRVYCLTKILLANQFFLHDQMLI